MPPSHFVSAEFMYRPRPTDPRARRVFDFTLHARLAELGRYPGSAVLLICDSEATAASLAHLPGEHPALRFETAYVNPQPLPPTAPDTYRETPFRCAWPQPERWRRYSMTDRWARIQFALDYASTQDVPGYLIMPAHDAVWGHGLLDALVRFSVGHAQNGLPAAVSPYSPLHHSTVPGADIPDDVIDGLNVVFDRDSSLRARLERNEYQAFWGKMGMIPFGMCDAVRRSAETFVWEDDLEIDRAIRALGYAVRCLWVDDPALYRQALPVFDRAGLKAVIDRTLHYSLNIPGDTSILSRPLDAAGLERVQFDSRFARAVALSESIAAECQTEIDERLEQFGQSWVDWGAYRYAVRVGDPVVQVWKL